MAQAESETTGADPGSGGPPRGHGALVIIIMSGLSGGPGAAIKADMSLVCFGDNSEGKCDVPAELGAVTQLPAAALWHFLRP